jgi:hypothetical protein
MIKIGSSVFVKTVTNYFVGTVVQVETAPDGSVRSLVLEPAAWVADTARRQSQFLAEGPSEQSEIERYPGAVLVPWHCVTECSSWAHAIPESR